jgi:hypothetical protein
VRVVINMGKARFENDSRAQASGRRGFAKLMPSAWGPQTKKVMGPFVGRETMCSWDISLA